MGLRETIAQWIATVKDALDFGPEFPTSVPDHHVTLTEQMAELQHLLEETRRAVREKEELIAKLQAAGKIQGNMIVDGSAYYVKRANILEGPFCLSCFQQSHEIVRIGPAPKPEGADGDPAQWVQCGRCRTPFRSERIGQYLNSRSTAPMPTQVLPPGEEAKPVSTARKPRSRTRKPKAERSEGTKPEDQNMGG